MRQVTYFVSTNNEKRTIQSSANTWGELKDELGLNSIRDMKYVLRETKATLESSEIILPSSDIVILGFPQKNKSGLSTKDVLRSFLRDVVDAANNAIQIIEEVDETDEAEDELAREARELADSMDN